MSEDSIILLTLIKESYNESVTLLDAEKQANEIFKETFKTKMCSFDINQEPQDKLDKPLDDIFAVLFSLYGEKQIQNFDPLTNKTAIEKIQDALAYLIRFFDSETDLSTAKGKVTTRLEQIQKKRIKPLDYFEQTF